MTTAKVSNQSKGNNKNQSTSLSTSKCDKNVLSASSAGWSTSTKLSLLVLFASLALFYTIGQHHDQSMPESLIIGLDHFTKHVINSDYDTQQWTKWLWNKLKDILDPSARTAMILNGLLVKEQSVSVRSNVSLAIGLGACTDLVVDSLKIFHKFAAPNKPQPHKQIDSMRNLLELFAYYFKHGAASERYIQSKAVFNELLKLIHKSPDIWREHIGGNAPLMSERFVKEGINRILLGAQVSEKFAKRLPSQVELSGPIIEQDDYHILLEYKTDQQWGPYKSPRANRLIVHSDDNNAQLVSRMPYLTRAATFDPDLLVISGLQMLDNSPIDFEVRSNAIAQLGNGIGELRQMFELRQKEQSESSKRLRVHFEMASYTENLLLGVIVDDIFPHVDSFGMNEQEVVNLLSYLKFGNISFVSSPFPRIAHVLDDLRELFSLLNLIGENRVSRIHVHTLAYQVVAVRVDSNGYSTLWPHTAAAMAKASLTAYRHTCGDNHVDLKKARILLDDSFTTSNRFSRYKQRIYFEPDQPTVCWIEELAKLQDTRPHSQHNQPSIKVKFCLSIGLVCTNVIQTGGAGDNVSAGGLVLQV